MRHKFLSYALLIFGSALFLLVMGTIVSMILNDHIERVVMMFCLLGIFPAGGMAMMGYDGVRPMEDYPRSHASFRITPATQDREKDREGAQRR